MTNSFSSSFYFRTMPIIKSGRIQAPDGYFQYTGTTETAAGIPQLDYSKAVTPEWLK